MIKILLSSATLAVLFFAGCGSSSEQAVQTVTVVEKTVIEKPAAPAEKPKPAASKPEPAAEPTATIKVPNVVGENHQYAQDTMQAAGLYNLDERDATGQGRMLVWDRNWVVVEQDPPAGTVVDEDTTITLSSKKKDE